MAKAILLIEDTLDGAIDIKCEFDPEYNQAHKATPAQNMVAYIIEHVVQKSKEAEPVEEGEAEEDNDTEETQEGMGSDN